MLLRSILNFYHLLLSLGAFYFGGLMFLGKGAFDTWPQEWVGKIPFTSWVSLALFGIIIFGIGNAIASTYGFIKKDNKIYLLTIIMGALFFFCTVLSRILLGEWYLPTSQFWKLSLLQILLGLFGLVTEIIKRKMITNF